MSEKVYIEISDELAEEILSTVIPDLLKLGLKVHKRQKEVKK